MNQDQGKLSNVAEFTVSELSNSLKRKIEDAFGHVRVRAELSGVSRPASGHLYMALKDDKSVMDAVCWRGIASRLPFKPEDGLEVVVTGKLTTYAARSKYQMIVEHMEPAGAGALMALLEARKKKLSSEGLFEQARKKKIPFIPTTIGVITSPTGAVIRDILHRLNDRFPRHVIVWPVKVQGEGADKEIVRAIEGFNNLPAGGGVGVMRPDVLIVARGGGSIEDLWSFNEEIVVRAAAGSQIPLISSVGHETDTTLIDYASDLRAPTPTAAAEMAVPVRADLLAGVNDLSVRLERIRGRIVADREESLRGLVRGLPSPHDLLAIATQRLDDLVSRLPFALKAFVDKKRSTLHQRSGGLSPVPLRQLLRFRSVEVLNLQKRLDVARDRKFSDYNQRLSNANRLLDSLSYERVLDRGFTVILDQNGKPVSRASLLEEGQSVSARFSDGERAMVVTDEGGPSKGATPPVAIKKSKSRVKPKRNNPSNNPDNQGSLF